MTSVVQQHGTSRLCRADAGKFRKSLKIKIFDILACISDS
jgi:hypothetical protein